MKTQYRQKGNAFIGAMVAAGVVAVAALGTQQYYLNFVQQSRATQIRSLMTAHESIIRIMAMQPYIYRCGLEAGGLALSNFSSCILDKSHFDALNFTAVPGSHCDTENCGIHLTIDETQVTSGRFQAVLDYNGTDAFLRPIEINIAIPLEILQSSVFSCQDANPNTPAFVGFRADGMPECRGFTNMPCGPGTYIDSVDFRGLSVSCRNLRTADKSIGCGYGQMISGLNWQNGNASASCAALPVAPLVGGGVTWTDTQPIPAPTPVPTPIPPPRVPAPTPTPPMEPTGTPEDPCANGGCNQASCFIASTMIDMEDGTKKRIDQLEPGDRLVGATEINTVVYVEKVPLAGRLLYAINSGEAFVTPEHPFWTPEGWKSFSPEATAKENPNVPIVGPLNLGDLVLKDGKWIRIKSLRKEREINRSRTVYNPILTGDHTYFADGYLVHNKN